MRIFPITSNKGEPIINFLDACLFTGRLFLEGFSSSSPFGDDLGAAGFVPPVGLQWDFTRGFPFVGIYTELPVDLQIRFWRSRKGVSFVRFDKAVSICEDLHRGLPL